jgi:hypothetical protein
MSLTNGRMLRVVGVALAVAATGATPASAGANRPSYVRGCKIDSVFAGARTCTYTFRYSQTVETFVVPPTTEPVQITAVGAPGAGDRGYRSRGALVTGSFPNLGGGGGASDVRLGVPDLAHRIMVAAGGGGWGEEVVFDEQAGVERLMLIKGGDAGLPGSGSGGQPGTATAGGIGGGTQWAQGQPGRIGRGGAGAPGINGGGGGGLYGGGGGGGCSGYDADGSLCPDSQPGSGGGGSSLIPRGGTSAVSDDFEPRVIITVLQYAPWPVP